MSPETVARLTPMVASITPDGDRWRWQLSRIPVLGRSFELAFTEQMSYDEPSRITFRHAPEGDERAGTDGRYDLSDADGDTSSTHLRIELEVSVDGCPVRLGQAAALLVLHLAAATGPLHIEQVGDRLWPDAKLPVIRQRLNSLVHRIRRQHPALRRR